MSSPIHVQMEKQGFSSILDRPHGALGVYLGFDCVEIHKWASSLTEEQEVWLLAAEAKSFLCHTPAQLDEYASTSTLAKSDMQKLQRYMLSSPQSPNVVVFVERTATPVQTEDAAWDTFLQ